MLKELILNLFSLMVSNSLLVNEWMLLSLSTKRLTTTGCESPLLSITSGKKMLGKAAVTARKQKLFSVMWELQKRTQPPNLQVKMIELCFLATIFSLLLPTSKDLLVIPTKLHGSTSVLETAKNVLDGLLAFPEILSM